MDFCRNVSVSGGLPPECPAEQVLSPPCSKLGGLTGTLDDLFSGHNTEVDVSLEWLSIFVEDCLSSTGNCLPAAAAAPTNLENSSSTILPKPSKPSLQQQLQKPQQINPPPSSLRRFVIPSKARSKRKRAPTPKNITKPLLTSWAHHFNHHPQNQNLHINNPSSDPPLLQQAYWLADSELINVPKPKPKPKEEEDIIISRGNSSSSSSSMRDIDEVVLKEEKEEEGEEEEEKMVGSKERSSGSIEGSSNGQARRCTHCLAQRTPQWRAGPLGPKTLCNACGVRYKSGRLLPEYRPAKSPTFVSYLHSNSHKKVMEMRMSLLSSIPTQQ